MTSVLSHNSGQTSLVQQLAYTAFGAIGSIKDGQGNNDTGPISRFAYTGREFDPETGDYYYRARYYDPQTGRFLSQDPIGFAAGDMNLYRYVNNSSPNFVDPSGLRAGQHTTTDQPLGRTVPVGPGRYNDGVGPQRSLPGFSPQGNGRGNQYWTTNAIMPTGGLPPSDPTIVTLPTGGQFPGPTTITLPGGLPGGTIVPLYPEPVPVVPPNTEEAVREIIRIAMRARIAINGAERCNRYAEAMRDRIVHESNYIRYESLGLIRVRYVEFAVRTGGQLIPGGWAEHTAIKIEVLPTGEIIYLDDGVLENPSWFGMRYKENTTNPFSMTCRKSLGEHWPEKFEDGGDPLQPGRGFPPYLPSW